MIKHAVYVAASMLLLGVLMASESMAMENIVKPYQSARSSGMGGVKITTGLYDENFFGNPARVTQNPNWKIQIFDVMAETTTTTLDTVSDLAGGGDALEKIGGTAGKNSHGRVQTTFPSVYWPNVGGGKWSYALGLIMSSQFDVNLRRSYRVEPAAITDVGPALTIGRKLLAGDKLSVGATAHATYRLATQSGFSFVDIIRGASLSPLKSGGEGSHIDFDLGAFYEIPWQPRGWVFKPGASINNLLGGKYSNLGFRPVGVAARPPAQPRSYNAGLSANRATLGPFTSSVFALEIQDVGNNPDGSLFRTVHLGGEVRYGILAPRLGLNQGYIAGGLGIDAKVFELDLATYGEEMGLNVGSFQDRRFAVKLGFKI